MSRASLKKFLGFSVPHGYRRTAKIKRPKLDGFTGFIDQWMLEDLTCPDVLATRLIPIQNPKAMDCRFIEQCEAPIPYRICWNTRPRVDIRFPSMLGRVKNSCEERSASTSFKAGCLTSIASVTDRFHQFKRHKGLRTQISPGTLKL